MGVRVQGFPFTCRCGPDLSVQYSGWRLFLLSYGIKGAPLLFFSLRMSQDVDPFDDDGSWAVCHEVNQLVRELSPECFFESDSFLETPQWREIEQDALRRQCDAGSAPSPPQPEPSSQASSGPRPEHPSTDPTTSTPELHPTTTQRTRNPVEDYAIYSASGVPPDSQIVYEPFCNIIDTQAGPGQELPDLPLTKRPSPSADPLRKK
jgi:hypothetical protein